MRHGFMWLYSNLMHNICLLSVADDEHLFDAQLVYGTSLQATVAQVSVLYEWHWLEIRNAKDNIKALFKLD